MGRVAVLVIVLAACGRLGFQPLPAGDGGIDGSRGDSGGDAAVPRRATYLKASNPDVGDNFGIALAISGDGSTIAVSAVAEDSASRVIDGNQADNTADKAGAVYIFVRSGSTWVQQAYLKAANADAGDEFGHSLAFSSDGNVLAVGAMREDSGSRLMPGDNGTANAGAVYVFTRTGTTWTQQDYIKPTLVVANDEFGYAIALSANGDYLAASAHFRAATEGIAYVFLRSGATWVQQAQIRAASPAAGDSFGESIDLSADGATLAIGAYLEASSSPGINGNESDNSMDGAGAGYVYTRSGTTWTQQAFIKSPTPDVGDEVGNNVVLDSTGDRLWISAHLEDSTATGIGGDPANNGAIEAGGVFELSRIGTTWSHRRYIKATNTEANDVFGLRLAVTADGSLFAAGAIGEDSASPGFNGDQTDNSAPLAGAVYLYDEAGPLHYVKALDPENSDNFVFPALSADGSVLVVGAYGEDGGDPGVDGDPTDNSLADSGAVFVYW